ncbi:hypothetical protein F5878DRAFT_626366 [Lentinula raphanica]|uniref:Uncharacterized protein n=1 Tax=Lentinula raphanica TaxID=153919 RepID=A0AA38P4E3_9AGAR|nr:hypothetical protein F5878DRAFT_626366 [Lentinula raphanica]
MGRPLWSTVHAASTETHNTKAPRTWDPNDPFDPDSDAFFADAEVEIPVAEAPATTTELDVQSYLSRTVTNSVEHSDSREGVSPQHRIELLTIMLQQRRTEVLETIRRAREMTDNQEQAERTGIRSSQQTATPSITSAPPYVASGSSLSSGGPVSRRSRLLETGVHDDVDPTPESPMQFALPDHRRSRVTSSGSSSRQNASRGRIDHTVYDTDTNGNTRRAEDREVELAREQRRMRLRELVRMAQSEEAAYERRVSSSSRQRRESVFFRLAALRARYSVPVSSGPSRPPTEEETRGSTSVLRAQRVRGTDPY